ncbi:PepSY domain-containing protein [Methylopila musalis]|uniref:PepSY domain-containing protein n=1 Tax=Methylopila musalis TaxID=1134781 RepID=A0ABW3Z826_9HYPH
MIGRLTSPRWTRTLIGAAALALALTLGQTAPGHTDDTRAHYEASEALKSGRVRPLEEIVAIARKEIGGDIIEIEFEHDDGRYIYELEIISPSGKLLEVKIDAATGVILSREGQ